MVQVPHDTMWVRDYGPVFVQLGRSRRAVIDTGYHVIDRDNDDAVPVAAAAMWHVSIFHAPMTFEGGNLLSNGCGLCVTTTRVALQNFADEDAHDAMRDAFEQYFGAEETIFLEPLVGEATGHVDMFAAFTDPGTIVVGSYDPEVDPVNAEILDRNAARLAGVPLRGGFLHVVRIPMPPNKDGLWRTYTNIIFANSAVLVPIYDGVDYHLQNEALEGYRRLLPGWTLVPVDVSELIRSGGALHCIAANIPAPQPADIPLRRAAR
jgi:agmatine/peptidylarginine deiminase